VLRDAHGDRAGAADIEVAVRPDPDRGEVDLLVADRGTTEAPGGLPTASGVRAGHGIGLFLVRRFLDAAEGRSFMAERQGGGTVVGLSLPLRQRQGLEDAVNT
jgi:two-component sensor histidine kinase